MRLQGVILGVLIGILALVLSAANSSAKSFPEIIPLPDGFEPEGVAVGYGYDIYAGSLATGAVYRADLRTGEGSHWAKEANCPLPQPSRKFPSAVTLCLSLTRLMPTVLTLPPTGRPC